MQFSASAPNESKALRGDDSSVSDKISLSDVSCGITDTHCHIFRTADSRLISLYPSVFNACSLNGEMPVVRDDFLLCRDEGEVDAFTEALVKLTGNSGREVFEELERLLLRSAEASVSEIMAPAVTHFEGLRNLRLLRVFSKAHADASFPEIFCGMGVHPMYAGDFSREKLRTEYELIRSVFSESPAAPEEKSVTADGHPVKKLFVGEIGIDKRFRDTVPLDVQTEALHEQLIFAVENHLPVNIHGVGGDNEILHELKRLNRVKGIIHAFTGNSSRAEQYLRRGLKLGIGPMLLATESHKLEEAVRYAGIDNLVLETDYPYMYMNLPENSSSSAPDSDSGGEQASADDSCFSPRRRSAASPDLLIHIVERLSEIFGIGKEETAGRLHRNVEELF